MRSFRSEGKVTYTADGVYVHRDNGSNILAVAHLDTVQPRPRHFGYAKGFPDWIYNTQLDDRLGAWIILDVLPSIGVNVDVLLTEGEESCRSTATHFHPNGKDYNWVVEFDRGGTDVVLYDYETPELVELLESLGNEVGQGSYSDISVMEYLGVACFNWGVGSYNGHSPDSNFSVSECKEAIARFVEFYKANENTKIPHIPYYKPWNDNYTYDDDDLDYVNPWREERDPVEELIQWEIDNWETKKEHQHLGA